MGIVGPSEHIQINELGQLDVSKIECSSEIGEQ
jgi:hypothetical protein